MDMSNGYINATKMCQNAGKEYSNWSRLKGSQELIQTLHSFMVQEGLSDNADLTLGDANHQMWGLASSPCIFKKTDNNTHVQQIISGTYAHPDLIPSIAGWISPEFQIKANRIVNGYMKQGYKIRLEAIQLELEQAKEVELLQRQENLQLNEQCEAAKLVAYEKLKESQELKKVVACWL